jgi:hypothetical protein
MQLLDGYVTNLLQLPCCCVFLLGLTMQLNFSRVGDNTMQLHYPVILLGLIGVLILNPFPIFCYRSRKRLLYRLVNLYL